MGPGAAFTGAGRPGTDGLNANTLSLEILNMKTRMKSIMTVNVPPLFAYISFWFIKKQLVTVQATVLYIDEISQRH